MVCVRVLGKGELKNLLFIAEKAPSEVSHKSCFFKITNRIKRPVKWAINSRKLCFVHCVLPIFIYD